MDVDSDDDDLYAPTDEVPSLTSTKNAEIKMRNVNDAEEEGEEVEDEDDSDVRRRLCTDSSC